LFVDPTGLIHGKIALSVPLRVPVVGGRVKTIAKHISLRVPLRNRTYGIHVVNVETNK